MAKISDLHLSVLKEISNIGTGSAAQSLSTMLGRDIQMSVPNVSGIEISKLESFFGGPESVIVGTFMELEGDLEGDLAFLFTWNSALELWKMLVNTTPDNYENLSELEESVVLEVCNILSCGFIKALSDMTQLNVQATPAYLSIEMCTAIINSLISNAYEQNSMLLVADTKIHDEKNVLEGSFLFIPREESFKVLLSNLTGETV